MQIAIDNAKRKADLDLNENIRLIKQDMNVEENKYPGFWFILQRKNNFSKSKSRKGKINKNVEKIYASPLCNSDLKCPMNYLFELQFPMKNYEKIIPNSQFFVKYENDYSATKSKRIEKLIGKYNIDLHKYNLNDEENDDYASVIMDFEELIEDLRTICLPKSELGLMSYLIDRALLISPSVKSKKNYSNASKNKITLLKVLYTLNKDNFLKCFSGNLPNFRQENDN